MKLPRSRVVKNPGPSRARFAQALAVLVLAGSLGACATPAGGPQEQAGIEPAAHVGAEPAESSATASDQPVDPATVSPAKQEPAGEQDKQEQSKQKPDTREQPGQQDKSAEKSAAADAPDVEDAAPKAWAKVKDAQKIAADAKAATREPDRAKPVELEDKVTAGERASVSITKLELTKGEANGIGEIAGPAALVEIRIQNKGGRELDLTRAQLRLYVGPERQPAALLTDSRGNALPERLAAGKSVTAVYVFALPESGKQQVAVEFETGTTGTIQQLTGWLGP